MNAEIEQLQQELFHVLKKASRNRKIIKVSRLLTYGGAMIYFIALICMQVFIYSGGDTSLLYTLDPDPTFFEKYKTIIVIAPLFILITIGGYGVSHFQQKYTEMEQSSIRKIIRRLFPDARLNLTPYNLSIPSLFQSNLFGWINRDYSSGVSFGKISFGDESREFKFQDVLVGGTRTESWLSKTQIGGFILVVQTMFKGMFSKRIENITGNFRGMYAEAKLEKNINGSVVILPDYLEKHLDYLAKNIQALKNINGNKLVKLEDVDFERYFAVYSNDEILARYILTPAMMSRITELRRKYNRAIMLSFNGDRFYFAVSMPEGFLTLGDGSYTSGEALSDFYDNIAVARGILVDLNVK